METNINPSVIKQFLLSRIHNQRENYIHPPFALEQQLMDAIQLENYEMAKEINEKINKLEGATLAPNPIRSRKNALIAFCTLFTRAIIKGGVYPETAFNLSDAYILEIEKTNSLDKLNKLEYDMLFYFIKTLKDENKVDKYSHPVNLAINYINDNILQHLSLENIAQHVYLHPSYLSNKFKQEVGISIKDFINKKRIEESKYFLIHTNSPISEIAFLFRFCNQSYYTFLFKSYTGMTPWKYRQFKQQL